MLNPTYSTAETFSDFFSQLNDVDLSGKIRKKNGLSYVPWSNAWSEIRKRCPSALIHVYEWEPSAPVVETTETFDKEGHLTERRTVSRPVEPKFWFTAGNTCYVKVGVSIDGVEQVIPYPILDYRNQPIPADKVTTFDANKSQMRALAKACALHGLGLFVFEGEELPEATKKAQTTLAASRKKVITTAQTAVKRGVDRDAIYSLIGEKNGGVQDPNKLPSAAICEEVIQEISTMKPDKK